MTVSMIRFSEVLRTRTRAQHRTSSGSGFMSDLLHGSCSTDEYAWLVAQYRFVYGALESAADVLADDPVAALFIDGGLTRVPALERDLDFLLGPDWRSRVAPLPSTLAYVERLETVATRSAGAFVAHHYTRYLGDLSGGQFIKTVLQREYGFDTDGVGFYMFDEVPDPSAFKAAYRKQLDAAPWSDEEKESVVAEVTLAYELNTALLAGLDERRGAAA